MSLPKCEHGVCADDGRYNGSWNAPFSQCKCCGIHFPYIGSCSFGSAGSKGTLWTPMDRCANCGGKYESWSMPSVDVIEREGK
jgi:hypothetical protein